MEARLPARHSLQQGPEHQKVELAESLAWPGLAAWSPWNKAGASRASLPLALEEREVQNQSQLLRLGTQCLHSSTQNTDVLRKGRRDAAGGLQHSRDAPTAALLVEKHQAQQEAN